jgi:hypothetical protein
MNEVEIARLLDAHDALVAACVDRELPFIEFVVAYGDFPEGYGLDEGTAAPETRAILPLFRKRIAFHRHVARVLSGFRQGPKYEAPDNLGGFLQQAIMIRLREIVARYSDFQAESPVATRIDPVPVLLVREKKAPPKD